jgi:hypothetical protein
VLVGAAGTGKTTLLSMRIVSGFVLVAPEWFGRVSALLWRAALQLIATGCIQAP